MLFRSVVTGVAGGETTITVATADGSMSATVKVNVTVPLEGLEITGTAKDKAGTADFDGMVNLVINANDADALIVKAIPENADMEDITFESSDEDIVTVDAEGKLTARANGEATVTARVGEITAEVTVKVNTAPEKIMLEDESLEVGQTKTLEVTFAGENITVGKKLTWSSSDEDVAVIDEDGVVTAKSEGEVTVTATNEFGQKAECKIVVNKPAIATRPTGNSNTSGSGNSGGAPSTSTPTVTDTTSGQNPAPTPTPPAPPAPPAQTNVCPYCGGDHTEPYCPLHYHGNGTDAGQCPVCGSGYSPTVDPSTAPDFGVGD